MDAFTTAKADSWIPVFIKIVNSVKLGSRESKRVLKLNDVCTSRDSMLHLESNFQSNADLDLPFGSKTVQTLQPFKQDIT